MLATAAGFFFTNESKLYLITNRHVVREESNHFFPDKLRIRSHTNVQDHTQNSDFDVPCITTRNQCGERYKALTSSRYSATHSYFLGHAVTVSGNSIYI